MRVTGATTCRPATVCADQGEGQNHGEGGLQPMARGCRGRTVGRTASVMDRVIVVFSSGSAGPARIAAGRGGVVVPAPAPCGTQRPGGSAALAVQVISARRSAATDCRSAA